MQRAVRRAITEAELDDDDEDLATVRVLSRPDRGDELNALAEYRLRGDLFDGVIDGGVAALRPLRTPLRWRDVAAALGVDEGSLREAVGSG